MHLALCEVIPFHSRAVGHWSGSIEARQRVFAQESDQNQGLSEILCQWEVIV